MKKIEEELSNQSLIIEKLTCGGVATLCDEELFSIVIGRGEVKEQHIERAKKLLKTHKTLDAIFENENLSLPSTTITLINAIRELNNRLTKQDNNIQTIENNQDAEHFIRPLLKDAVSEEFWVVAINRAGRVIDKRCISKGGLNSSMVDMKLLMQYIIGTLASSIIVAHNHPSGAIEPSQEDIEVTKKIVSALTFFDIKLLDHLIIGDKETYSFRANGII